MSKARKRVTYIILFAIFALIYFTGIFSNFRRFGSVPNKDYSTQVTDYTQDTSFAKTDEVVPDYAVSIGDGRELQEFLMGGATYGCLISDVSIDWDGVGSTLTFGSGRVLDGRGHSITLTDKEADAIISEESYGVTNVNWSGFARECNYALFICVNAGVIKNTVFEYSTEICAVNNGSAEINGVGIVCGENKGTIENCELNVGGKFSYFYMEGADNYSESFQTYFGGFAGKNSGRIANVKCNYNDFYLRLRTIATLEDPFNETELVSKTVAGGIAGCMTDVGGECRNAIVLGENVYFHLTSDCVGDVNGIKYSGAVVGDNSCEATVDNIILKFAPEYVEILSDYDRVSKNAAVHCGLATNVTAIDHYGDGKHLRSVNCDCDSHKFSYCNTVYTDKLTDFDYGINDKGEQFFEITSTIGWMESISFNKYRIENGGFASDGHDYGENLEDFDSSNFDERWEDKVIINISPYQPSGEYCWEIKATSWRVAELEFSDGMSKSYTGQDVLSDFVRLKIAEEEYGQCDFTKFNLYNGDERIYGAVIIGEYRLSIKPTLKYGREFLYYDEYNRIAAPFPENYDEKTHSCFIIPAEAVMLKSVSGWTNEDFPFTLKDAIDGAADGLVYTIDNGAPVIENSLILHNRNNSSPSGSEYRVYLTKNGKRVSYDYVFYAKVDVCPPILKNVEFTNPIDGGYYTSNRVRLDVDDNESGIAYVRINGSDMEQLDGDYFADIEKTGRYEIIASDYAGNVLVYTFDALIDDFRPILQVAAFDESGKYQSGNTASSEVSITASAIFSESGGVIEYRIKDGEWEVYSESLTVSASAKIEFRAIANSFDGTSNLTSDTIVFEVIIEYPPIIMNVTADWFEIDKNKEYDGTDSLSDIKFDLLNENALAYFKLLGELDFSARYSSCDAGTDIEIIIDVWAKADSNIVVNNLTRGVLGNIFPRKINVTLISAEGTYGSEERKYLYEIDNAFEDIDLQFSSNANVYSVPDAEEYRFWLKEREYGNYTVDNFDSVNSFDGGAGLIIRKAVIYELANDANDFLDLDIVSVAKLQITFRDAIDSNITHVLDTSYLSISDGSYLPTEGINVAGTYRIKLFMPDNLKPMYILDESLYEIQLKINDVTIPDEETPPTDGKEETPPDETDDDESPKEEVPDPIVGDNNDSYVENSKTYSDVVKGVCAASASVAGVATIGLSVNKRVRRKKKK